MIQTCPGCKWPYPSQLLHSVMVSNAKVREDIKVEDGQTDPICPVCALGLLNAIHGSNKDTFSPGSAAERIRQEALRWRKQNRRKAPKSIDSPKPIESDDKQNTQI